MASESDFTPLFTLPRWSFGLRQLFLWTAAIALGLVALRSASPAWVAAMLGLVLLVLAASILLIVFRRGSQRAYWIGFATFGWLYILLLVTSWNNTDGNNPFRPYNLVTYQLSSSCYHWLYDKAFQKYYANSNTGSGGGYAGYSMMGGMESGYGSDMYGGMSADPGMGMMPGGGMPMGSGMGGPAPPPGPPPGPNEGDFVNVAHALWTLLLAALGGCLGYWLYATGPGRTERPAAAA